MSCSLYSLVDMPSESLALMHYPTQKNAQKEIIGTQILD